MNNKGNIAGGSVAAITSLIVGVGIAVMLLIFVGSLGGQTYNLIEDDINEIGVNVVTGDTFTALNNTIVKLDNGYIQSGTLKINNVTDKKAISLTQFTIDYTSGTVKLIGSKGNNNSAMVANYTWGAIEVQNSVKGGIISSFEALEQTGGYLPIIVLAIVITLVMVLVLGLGTVSMGGRGGSAL